MEKGELEAAQLKADRQPAGVDEVGRGCLAGPVVAAIAVLDYNKLATLDTSDKRLLRDSKTLSTRQRQKILPLLDEICLDYKIGNASVREIESIGIVPATFLAMRRAIERCTAPFDTLFVDGKQRLSEYDRPQVAVIDGDALVYAIAAASILAKEHRDDYMRKISERYPSYGFDTHVGYGTKQHLNALKQHGICPIHRKNFAPVSRLLATSAI